MQYIYSINSQLHHFVYQSVKDLPNLKIILEALNLKPNFSLISRDLNVDRRTVQKYYHGYTKPAKRHKQSKIQTLMPIIEQLLDPESIQRFYYQRNLWQYLCDNHQLDVAYSTFRHFVNQTPLLRDYFNHRTNRKKQPSPVRFETNPGEQLQLDWKENVELVTVDGEIITLNILVGLLSYSRYAVYVVSFSKAQDALLEAVDKIFDTIGGVPQHVLCDNASTMMLQPRTHYAKGIVHPKFDEFAKDYGFTVRPCIVRSPHTKGKVESQMKLLDELQAYNGKLTRQELIELVQKLNYRKNVAIHPTTKCTPERLFKDEKDFLSPLPNGSIRSHYQTHLHRVKVNHSSMITFQSAQYSVPAEYIGKTLTVRNKDNRLYIYDNTFLVTMHDISSNQWLNYHNEHYTQILSSIMPYKSGEELEEIARQNLLKMKGKRT